MARKEIENNPLVQENTGQQKAVKKIHKIGEVELGKATEEEKGYLKKTAKEQLEERAGIKEPINEEVVKTVEEPEMDVEEEQIIEKIDLGEYADVLPPGYDSKKMMSLLELPKNEEEKKVWQMWNKKLNAAKREYFFHEELPTHQEIPLEEVPTTKETAYGEQKVQEASSLEEGEAYWPDPDMEIIEETPIEFKDGKWIRSEQKLEQPAFLQEGNEDESDAEDNQEIWKIAKKEYELANLPQSEIYKHGKAQIEFDAQDWEPPKLSDLFSEAERKQFLPGEREEFFKLVQETVVNQFSERKKDFGKIEEKIIIELKKVVGTGESLDYNFDKLKEVNGIEKASSRIANILGRAKNLTETSLSRIAGSTMALGKEIQYFLKEKEKKGDKRQVELKKLEREIGMSPKTKPGIKERKKLARIRELREQLDIF